MSPKDFAKEYYLKLDQKSENELVLRQAIEAGIITPDMSLRKIGEVTGIGSDPNLIRHYLRKFLKEADTQGSNAVKPQTESQE